MRRITKYVLLMVTILLMADVSSYKALADHNDRKEKRRYQKRTRNHSEQNGELNLTPLNPAYSETCGACHFAYQSELLPYKAWEKILSGLDDHFGEVIEVNPESKKIISEYLRGNAADISSSKLSGKIMKSLVDLTPKRVTEVPYILRKHKKIDSEVFKRDSIGSFSKCSACHETAEKGIYDSNYASIPK